MLDFPCFLTFWIVSTEIETQTLSPNSIYSSSSLLDDINTTYHSTKRIRIEQHHPSPTKRTQSAIYSNLNRSTNDVSLRTLSIKHNRTLAINNKTYAYIPTS